MQFQSEAGRLLHAECVKRFGHTEDSQGRKIYGHQRIAQKHRDFIKAVLRGDEVITVEQPQKPAVDQQAVLALRTTHFSRKSAVARAVERRFITTQPGAHEAGRITRIACLLVAAASIAAGLSIDGTAFSVLASLPAPKLLAAALGRIA